MVIRILVLVGVDVDVGAVAGRGGKQLVAGFQPTLGEAALEQPGVDALELPERVRVAHAARPVQRRGA